MTRDIQDRLELFMGGVRLERLALNIDQVRKYNPPPNPAKTTDSRYRGYIEEFGTDSWELDALEPSVIATLIRVNVTALVDNKKWRAMEILVREERSKLTTLADKEKI